MPEKEFPMPRILILEDERVVARDLQKILAALGYETSMAASGEQAIEVARRDRPDLVLVDIRLAGTLDGIETAHALREQLDLSVVYLTAHSDEHTLERAKATEPCGYLVKPFDKTTLQTTLQMAAYKSTVERHRRIEHRWQTAVLDQLTVGLITADTAGMVTMINACGQSLTGWSEREALGQNVAQVLMMPGAAGKVSTTANVLEAALHGQEDSGVEGTACLVSKSGRETWVQHQASPVRDERRQVVGASLVFWPVAVSRQASTRPAAGADEPDSVTGLPGRAQATAEIQTLLREEAELFAALFVVDRYYLIARKYGTRTADELLTYYGTFLAQEVPGCKGLYRWTGPCFLALFGPMDCLQVAQRSIYRCTGTRLGKLFQPTGVSAMLTVSGSAQVYSMDGKPPDALIRQIDSYVAIQTKLQQL